MHRVQFVEDGGNEHLPLAFQPVPTLPDNDIEAFVECINNRRLDDTAPQFIPHVVRGGGALASKRIVAALALHPSDIVRSISIAYDIDQLHADEGRVNDPTIHHTESVITDAVFLRTRPEERLFKPETTILIDRQGDKITYLPLKIVTNELFDLERIDTNMLPNPVAAFRVVLGPGDVVVFGHTSLHAFRPRGSNRTAHASYIHSVPA